MERYGLTGPSAAAPQFSNLQDAYNYLFLCNRVCGPAHPRTTAALKVTEVQDPEGWVPRLLAGLAFPTPGCNLDPLRTTKAEATVRGSWPKAAPCCCKPHSLQASS
jgi:hypothetical protein